MSQSSSPAGTVNLTDLYKVLRGAAVIGLAALLTNLLGSLPVVDFGVWDQSVTIVCASLLELVRRYYRDYKEAP